jgi:hypothetical protein
MAYGNATDDVARSYMILTEINRVLSDINNTLGSALNEVCELITSSFDDPDNTSVNIIYNGNEYRNKNFRKTGVPEKYEFSVTQDGKGLLEIYHVYPQKSPRINAFVNNAVSLIEGRLTKELLSGIIYEKTERLKELKGLNTTSLILSQSKSFEEALKRICSILPEAYQFPQFTVARINIKAVYSPVPGSQKHHGCRNNPLRHLKSRAGLLKYSILKNFHRPWKALS